MNYSQEQIDRANAVNLEDFLRSQGETLVRSGKEYRWKAHDSLTVCGNKWFRHSQSRGGYPIDFVMEFYGKTFPEAVKMLTGETPEAEHEAPAAPSPEFRLPKRNITNVNAVRYLTESRGISPEIVTAFIDSGDIYEEAGKHNVVFVGRDQSGLPRYAHCRGTEGKFRIDVSGSDKAYGFCYQGTKKEVCVFEAPIDLLSFVSLYPKDWQSGSYLSLGGVGSKALDHFLEEHPETERVFLCLDSDKAGTDASLNICKGISDKIMVVKVVPSLKDWNEVLCHKDEPGVKPYMTVYKYEKAKPKNSVPMICFTDVEQTEVEWLWKPYIPFGKLTILQGNPGEGKTYFALQLAAACTNRIPLPNMEPMEPFNVIYQTAEDGLGDTVKPRLIEAGADLSRVLTINEEDYPLTLSDRRLEKAIVENQARLLIIDPIQAFLGANVDMNRANEVRPIVRQLGEVAQRTGCAIILIGHLNKAVGMQSTYRGLGSIDFTAVVRSLLFIGRTKDDPNVRVLTHEKSSLAAPGPSLAFLLGDDEGFRWIGEYEITADEMLSGSKANQENKTQQARTMICTMLAEGREVLSSEIDKAALEKGISSRTVRLAKNELGDSLKCRTNADRTKTYWME